MGTGDAVTGPRQGRTGQGTGAAMLSGPRRRGGSGAGGDVGRRGGGTSGGGGAGRARSGDAPRRAERGGGGGGQERYWLLLEPIQKAGGAGTPGPSPRRGSERRPRPHGPAGPGPSAVVVHEVVAARLLGDRRRRFGDLDVLQVQEPQLHFHAQQRVQVALGQLTGHVLPQEGVKPINPDTVLWKRTGHSLTPGINDTLCRIFLSMQKLEYFKTGNSGVS